MLVNFRYYHLQMRLGLDVLSELGKNYSPLLENGWKLWYVSSKLGGICALRGKFEKMPIFAIFCGLLEFGVTWGNFEVNKVKRWQLGGHFNVYLGWRGVFLTMFDCQPDVAIAWTGISGNVTEFVCAFVWQWKSLEVWLWSVFRVLQTV